MIFICIIVITCIPSITNRGYELVQTLINRLGSVHSHQWSEGSTFVHYRYYASIIKVIASIGLFRIIIGFGFRCGGIPFVVLFNQYPDTVYGTESDYIGFLYGLGIVGFIVIFRIIFLVMIKGKKIDNMYFAFGLVLLIGGIFYSLQMNWVLFLELMMIEAIKRRMPFDALAKNISKKGVCNIL